MTSWKPIIAGVDESRESARCAGLAYAMAEAAGAEYQFIHVVSADLGELAAQRPQEFSTVDCIPIRERRQRIEGFLQKTLPLNALGPLSIKVGEPSEVLAEAASDLGAGLLVLGGKHRSPRARRLGGSTVHEAVRTQHIPVLVTGDPPIRIRRILAAVDLSHAAELILGEAGRFAELFDTQLRVLHAVEPLPGRRQLTGMPEQMEHSVRVEKLLTRVRPRIPPEKLQKVVRYGRAADIIAEEIATWKPDLVVLGSHGKGWLHRMLFGSTATALLNSLPTSLLVVPIPALPSEAEILEGQLSAQLA